jgi:hypothetical protein
MPRFQIVEMAEAARSGRWVIEKVTPGEKPIPISFFASKGAAEKEAHRLNLYGPSEMQPMAGTRKLKRTAK